MRRLRPQTDEEVLIQHEINETNLFLFKTKIPLKAIKSIIIAILLVFFGMICLFLSLFSFGNSLEYLFGQRRVMLGILSLITIPSGSWTLILAYRCYYHYPGYRWPMLFL